MTKPLLLVDEHVISLGECQMKSSWLHHDLQLHEVALATHQAAGALAKLSQVDGQPLHLWIVVTQWNWFQRYSLRFLLVSSGSVERDWIFGASCNEAGAA